MIGTAVEDIVETRGSEEMEEMEEEMDVERQLAMYARLARVTLPALDFEDKLAFLEKELGL